MQTALRLRNKRKKNREEKEVTRTRTRRDDETNWLVGSERLRELNTNYTVTYGERAWLGWLIGIRERESSRRKVVRNGHEHGTVTYVVEPIIIICTSEA